MKVACLQYYPLFKQPQVNMSSASKILQDHQSSLIAGVDVLVLPEMSFSGYMFCSRADIEPFMEQASADINGNFSKSPSIQWAQRHGIYLYSFHY